MLKRPELSRKKIKILEYGLKARLSASPAQENLKKESKMHLNKKVWSAPKSTIRHFWSADRHFKSAELHSFGLWPNSLWVPIRHTLFDFFAKRCVPIRILPIIAYFLSILVSINRDWISKFSTFFYALGETPFHTLKFLTPLSGILS